MSDPARARKVADRIKVIVAEMLERRIKDERLGFVTVTDVRVTNDLQHASIFYTVFGSAQDRTATEEALADNRGRIRSAVGKGLQIRLTPSIEFILDAIPEGAAHLEEVLAVAKKRDAELAARAAGARYAGDADPYRRTEGELDDQTFDAIEDVEPTRSELTEVDPPSQLETEEAVEDVEGVHELDKPLDEGAAVEDELEYELPRTLQAEDDGLVDDAPDDEAAEELLEDDTFSQPDPSMQDEMDGGPPEGDDRGIGRQVAEEEPTAPELPVAQGVDIDEDMPTDLAGDVVQDPIEERGPERRG